MKNLRPIWTMGIPSSSMILRKCRIEKPAISAAVGMSKNIFVRGCVVLVVSAYISEILPLAAYLSIWCSILLIGGKANGHDEFADGWNFFKRIPYTSTRGLPL